MNTQTNQTNLDSLINTVVDPTRRLISLAGDKASLRVIGSFSSFS